MDSCLQGGGGEKRWLVFETPRPEERMVAACLVCTATATPGMVRLQSLIPLNHGRLCVVLRLPFGDERYGL